MSTTELVFTGKKEKAPPVLQQQIPQQQPFTPVTPHNTTATVVTHTNTKIITRNEYAQNVPKTVHQAFVPAGTKLENVTIGGVNLIGQETIVQGDRVQIKTQSAQLELKPQTSSLPPQVSPSHCSASLYALPPSSMQKRSVAKVETLIQQVYQGDDENKNKELAWLEQYRNKWLGKSQRVELAERSEQLEKNLIEQKEDSHLPEGVKNLIQPTRRLIKQVYAADENDRNKALQWLSQFRKSELNESEIAILTTRIAELKENLPTPPSSSQPQNG